MHLNNLKKAFDTGDHLLLLKKCESYGLRGPIFQLLKSYLKHRKQYVATKNANLASVFLRDLLLVHCFS